MLCRYQVLHSNIRVFASLDHNRVVPGASLRRYDFRPIAIRTLDRYDRTMARPMRIELAGGLYHVTSRGDGREDIYLSDSDRQAWLDVFAEVCARFRWTCHAWCQMTNHYHVVVETAEGNLSVGMRQLNGVYSQRFNRSRRRVGHVFQGRYKAILVEKDTYLLELARYVVLNPVRAGMVSAPAEWPWSSHRATIGAGHAPPWLQTDWILRQFAQTGATAISRYETFVQQGMARQSVWRQVRGDIYLGSDRFVEQFQERDTDRSLAEFPRAQRRPLAQPLDYYRREYRNRNAAMAAAYASGDYTMQRIAEAFGVHYATVSRVIRAAADVRQHSEAVLSIPADCTRRE